MLSLQVLSGFLFNALQLQATDTTTDGFSPVRQIMNGTNSQNCSLGARVTLPLDTVSHVPWFVGDPSRLQPSNRTSLQYAYNTAANRAIFLSLMDNMTSTFSEWKQQPGLQYLYLSTAATAHAGPTGVSSSGLFFGPNKMYPNWIPTVSFNQTIPLFGVRANRMDGLGHEVRIKDLGTTQETNYTNHASYPQNQFFSPFRSNEEPYALRTMTMNLHQGQGNPNTITFDLRMMARGQIAQVVQPYYDCGQTNRWLVSVVSIAGERLARYSHWRHLVRYRNVALSTVDVEVETLDINVCPASVGNPNPNPFAGTATCPATQQCKVTHGNGFVRDGYTCCQSQNCPDESRATPDFRLEAEREMDETRSVEECEGLSSQLVLNDRFWSMDDLKVTFEVQGRAGLRLALFLSAFLQINDPDQAANNRAFWDQAYRDYTWTRDSEPEADTPMRYLDGDHTLTSKQLLSEAFSTLVSDGTMVSVGIFMESGVVFEKTDPMGAFAWRDSMSATDPQTGFQTDANVADLYEVGEDFTQWEWFRQARSWYSFLRNSDLTEYKVDEEVRLVRRNHGVYNSTVHQLPSSLSYYAKDYQGGKWLLPHFPCSDQRHPGGWIVSYLSPIFGKPDDGEQGPSLAGVVKVDVAFTSNHVHQRAE